MRRRNDNGAQRRLNYTIFDNDPISRIIDGNKNIPPSEEVQFTNTELHLLLQTVSSRMNETEKQQFLVICEVIIYHNINIPTADVMHFVVYFSGQTLMGETKDVHNNKKLTVDTVVTVTHTHSRDGAIDPTTLNRYLRLLIDAKEEDTIWSLRKRNEFYFRNVKLINGISSPVHLISLIGNRKSSSSSTIRTTPKTKNGKPNESDPVILALLTVMPLLCLMVVVLLLTLQKYSEWLSTVSQRDRADSSIVDKIFDILGVYLGKGKCHYPLISTKTRLIKEKGQETTATNQADYSLTSTYYKSNKNSTIEGFQKLPPTNKIETSSLPLTIKRDMECNNLSNEDLVEVKVESWNTISSNFDAIFQRSFAISPSSSMDDNRIELEKKLERGKTIGQTSIFTKREEEIIEYENIEKKCSQDVSLLTATTKDTTIQRRNDNYCDCSNQLSDTFSKDQSIGSECSISLDKGSFTCSSIELMNIQQESYNNIVGGDSILDGLLEETFNECCSNSTGFDQGINKLIVANNEHSSTTAEEDGCSSNLELLLDESLEDNLINSVVEFVDQQGRIRAPRMILSVRDSGSFSTISDSDSDTCCSSMSKIVDDIEIPKLIFSQQQHSKMYHPSHYHQ